ncbi:DUF1802 family protein [Roseibacillus ishigakijimensis]|uniref:DUF1802 family protein n=1 Tax=Roseibacillus ishigakijimensis TaxID=454146 RepID=A0A934VJP5_9BACT|nr:DUF1802 family protein [Roseibacillus ishigakijimensis]MBK1832819.1 DUF1802 family protein [Roseibacillus ishigakijimensis]
MIAFKEWQTVCAALAAGRQRVILRKGGIHEGREGFAWKHERFALFPTRFHAQREGLKPADWERFGEGPFEEWQEGEVVPIRWECVVEKAVTLESWEEVAALDEAHIWTEEVVRERFAWEMKGMKGQSLHAAFVETRELAEPFEVTYAKRLHGGCRSWLELKK